MKNIFNQIDAENMIGRIAKLSAEAQPLWGKMSVDQMLAHCNVTYELIYDNKHEKPNAFAKFLLKTFVKKVVVNDKPYSKNSRTGPVFLISSPKIFDVEKTRLVDYIKRTQQLGESHFEGKESHSFGKLNKVEWKNMMSKHLDHHLSQFGV